jgi:GGDEF domain-containing protein
VIDGGLSRFSAVSECEEVSMESTPARDYYRNLQYEALFDRATGLPAEALLLDRIEMSTRSAYRVGKTVLIAYIEVAIANGDEALARSIAARLSSALRGDDTIARVAPNEFVIVCNEITKADDVRPIVGRLVDSLHRRLAVAGTPPHLVSRIGVVFDATQRDPSELLENARRAMLAHDGQAAPY